MYSLISCKRDTNSFSKDFGTDIFKGACSEIIGKISVNFPTNISSKVKENKLCVMYLICKQNEKTSCIVLIVKLQRVRGWGCGLEQAP